MLFLFSFLFAAALALLGRLLMRHVAEAHVAVAVRKATLHTGSPPAVAAVSAAAAQAGNIFLRLLEKTLRRLKVFSLKLDNVATGWIQRLRKRSEKLSLYYHDWRIRKQGMPRTSFDSSFVSAIEDWFDGFFHRYFRRGVWYNRTAVRDDLEPREKVLVSAILKDPKNVEAYRALGLYYFEKGNLPDALSAFEAIRKIDPTNSEAADRVTHLREVMGMGEEEVME